MVRATLPKPDLLKIRRYAAGKVPVHLHDQIRIEVDTRGRSVTVVECRSLGARTRGWSGRAIESRSSDTTQTPASGPSTGATAMIGGTCTTLSGRRGTSTS